VFALDNTHVWAVGNDIKVDGQTTHTSIIYFNDGSNQWKEVKRTPGQRISALWAADPNHVWVVSQQTPNVMFFDGKSWYNEDVPFSGYLIDITGTDRSHVWACGQDGEVLFYDGEEWTTQTVGGSGVLCGIAAADPSHVWTVGWEEASGQQGVIYYFNGSKWGKQEAGTVNQLFAVCTVDSKNVWATGQNGIVLYWDGKKWEEQNTDYGVWLHDIAAADASNVWAVGAPTMKDSKIFYGKGAIK
jgi:hypothetical protein